MLIVISPAKSMDFSNINSEVKATQPIFNAEAAIVNKKLKTLSVKKLENLMGISSKLASLNFERNQIWEENPSTENVKQAILAFTGDVYQGMQAETFTPKEHEIAQEKIRILSGLYGILKPLDLIQAYRLEMGTKLPIGRKKDLYQYWSAKLTEEINKDLDRSGNLLVNLASNEYFKVIDQKKLKADVITPVFKDLKNGQYKMISFFAKKARGLMCRFVVENNINNPEDMKAFDLDGYYFNASMSKDKEWVFTRDH